MRRVRPSRVRSALVLLALLVVGGVAFLRSRFAWDEACTVARRRLPELLQMDVGIGRCEVDPLTQTVKLGGVSAFAPGAEEPLFAADALEVTLAGVQPFLGRLRISKLKVLRPRLRLDLSAPQPASKPSACPLEALQRVAIADLDIKGAEVSVKLPEGRHAEVTGLNLEWQTRRGAHEFRLETSRGLLNLGHGGKDFALLELRAEGGLDVSSLDVQVTRGELTLDEANVAFSGSVEQLCHPRVSLDAQAFLPMKAVAKALQSHDEVRGHVWAHLILSGKLEAPLVSGELVSKDLTFAPFHPGDFTARFAFAAPELTLHELSFSTGEGTVKVAGALRLTPGLAVRATVDLQGASFARILERAGLPGAWVDFLGTGRGTVQGKLLPTPQLTGELELKGERFRLTPWAFDAAPPPHGKPLLAFDLGHAKTGLRISKGRVEFLHTRIETERSRVEGDTTLRLGTAGGLEVHGATEGIDFGELRELAGIPWRGHASGRFDIGGPFSDLQIDAGLTVRDFEFANFALGVTQGHLVYRNQVLGFPSFSGQKGRTAYSGAAELDLHGKELHARGDVKMPAGRLEDVMDVLGKLSPDFFGMFQNGALAGEASGAVHIDCPASHLDGQVTLDLRKVAFQDRRLGDGQLALRFVNGEAMVLDKTTLVGPLGVSTVEGTYRFDGPLSYHFRVDPLSLEELVGVAAARKLGMAGTLSLVGTAEGTSEVPLVSAYLTSPKVSFGNRVLGAMQLEARMEGKDAEVWGQPFGDTHGSLKVKLQGKLPYEANFSLALPEIRPLLPDVAADQGLSGSVAGSISATGNLADASKTRADVTLDRLTLVRGDFSAQNVAPLHLAYAGGRLEMEPFEFAGPNTQLTGAGWLGPSDLDVRLHGTLDMRLLESFLPLVERSSGTVELNATATGKLKDPSVVGSATVHEVRMSLRDQPVELRGLSGHVEFSAARVLFEDMQAVLNDGRISLRGDVALRHFAVDHVEAGLQLDDVSWRLAEDLPFSTSGELLLSGKPSALVLTGDLDVQKFRYDRPLALDTFVAGLVKARRNAAGGSGDRPVEFLALDVGVHLKDARVDNNIARAKILGNLKVTGTNLRPGLLGTLETGEGSQAFFRGNQFLVTQGQMEFKNKYGLDGLFDVHAETQVREYLVRLHAFGRTTDPQVSLASEPALPEGDILSLLTLGVTSRDKGDSTRTGAGLAAEALFNVSGLDRQVQRFLPKNSVLRDLAFHISTTYNEASGLVEPTAQLESKFLTEQLKLRLSQPVSGHGTRAQAEYRFNNRLSAQGQWDNEQSDYSFGNLGLDLKLRWDVD